MLYVGTVLAAFCCAVCVIAVVWTRRVDEVDEPATPPVERVREEDLVRPAVDLDGKPTWVAPDEVVWHEIVHWPAPKVTTPAATTSGRRGRRAAS